MMVIEFLIVKGFKCFQTCLIVSLITQNVLKLCCEMTALRSALQHVTLVGGAKISVYKLAST